MVRQVVAMVAAVLVFAAFAETWDLTKGLPEGFKQGRHAVFCEQGLTTDGSENLNEPFGIQSKAKFAYPTAFRFAAELEIPDGRKGGLVWDDLYVVDGSKFGLRVNCSKGWQDKVYTSASLGFADKTITVSGPTLTTNEARRIALAFTFTANRTLLWEVNGVSRKCRVALSGGLGTGSHPFAIGDRAGSRHSPFDGIVKRVSIAPVVRAPAEMEVEVGRKAFLRAEEDATLPFWVVNYTDCRLTDAKVEVRQFADGTLVKKSVVPVADLAPDGKATLAAPVETRLRPCELRFELAFAAKGAGKDVAASCGCTGAICKRVGDNLPIHLWDSWGYYEEFGKLGFTKGNAAKFMRFTGYERGLKPTEEERIRAFKEFDDALKAGMTLGIAQPFMYPPNEDKEKFYRRNRDGSTKRDEIYKGPYPEVSQLAMQDFAREEAKFFINEFGSLPGFKGLLFCSEMRDASFPSFNTEHLRFKKETGLDVPELTPEEKKMRSRDWAKKRFAATKGIVPEDDPFYVYKTWWHGGGDGWPAFLSAAYDEYRRRIKAPDFVSHWDPAVRCHPFWTSGGSADMLGSWVYSNPEPMAVAGPTDETLAMARGRRPAQRVMAQLQAICYRRNIAPANERPDPEPAWFKTHPKAAFTTIPPDALREATWSALAKPVDEISYYGFESFFETGTDWYACTAPEAKDVLRDLCWNVIRPLGPTLKRLGRRRARVAILESFTSSMFGGHFEFGWQSMPYMQAQRARLDPQVVYEQEVLRDGLDGIDVVYAPHFVFTTQKVKDALDAFRRRGGILMTDSDHLEAIEPDVLAPDAQIWVAPKIDQPEGIEEQEAAKSGNAGTRFATARGKNVKLKNAELVRQRLAAKGFRPEVDSSSPEIIVYLRQHGDIPYVFAVNDKRTFGDYVGQWGRMMEKGLPFEGEVTIKDPGFRNLAVYELSRGGRVAFTRKDGVVRVLVKYETTDGRLLVFAEQKIACVELEAKVEGEGEERTGSRSLHVEMKVLGEDGRPMKGLWPVEVCVKDAAGNRIDGLDYGCAVDGVFTASVPLNINDAKGAYTVTCRDRASGRTKMCTTPPLQM